MTQLAQRLSGWERKVSGVIDEMKPLRKRKTAPYPYFLGEFRAYGLYLARRWAAFEAEQGIFNPDRDLAAEAYMLALEDLTIAYEMPDDGSKYGQLSSWFPEPPHNRSDLIEIAEKDADLALFRYCAP